MSEKGFKKITPETGFEESDSDKAVDVKAVDNTGEDTGNKENELKVKSAKSKTRKFRFGKKGKIALGISLAVLFAVTLLVIIPAIRLYRQSQVLVASAKRVKDSVTAQDMAVIKSEIASFRNELGEFDRRYRRFSWTAPLPFVGAYYKDGQAATKAGFYALDTADVLIPTIEPYADIIGFGGGQEAVSGEHTANDRINFIIETIDEVIPQMGAISEKAKLAHDELIKIDPNRYPEEVRGVKVRENIARGLTMAEHGTELISQAKPLIEQSPYLLGKDEPRTFLVIFQNDKELRPTGGFLTAYSVMTVDKGRVSPVSSNDIYNLDSRYRPTVTAAQPIVSYIKGPYLLSSRLRLRDMNWDPDFKNSMELFTTEAAKVGMDGIDGVIAVDTQMLVNLLDVVGPVGVPGYGNFSTEIDPRCDCPQVVYELESFADVEGPVVWDQNDPTKIIFAPSNYDNRKEIIGPLMNSVLASSLGQPKEKMSELFTAGLDSLLEKHVLFYLFDAEAQAAVEAFNIAGRIRDYEGDYLHVNDSNLGGRKSNLYVTSEVVQDIEIEGDGTVIKTLTITYKNPKEHDGWLNSVLPNWTRIYVPQGSELIETDGFEDEGEVYEESGKTVFSGGFELRPEGVKKITVKYRLPVKAEGRQYYLLVQKQPGTDAPLYTINFGKQTEELFLRTDKEFAFKMK